MRDVKYIVVFSIIGVALAVLVSGPLWKSNEPSTMEGTPLRSDWPASERQNPMEGATAQASRGVYAEGRLSLDPALKSASASGRPLFIIARAMAGGGPPVAVQRIDNPSFPLEFSIGPENNMVGTDFFDGDLTIVARLDKDGSAGPKQPEDWEGTVTLKSGGSRRVEITIKK